MPKCGGNSFRALLKQWFGDRLHLHYFSERENLMPPKYDLGPGCCVHGHFNATRNFGVEQYYPNVEQKITVLRDPLEVAISGYFFKLKTMKDGNYFRDDKQRTSPELSLVQHLEEKKSVFFDFLPFDEREEDYQAILDRYFLYIGILEDMGKTFRDLSHILQKPCIAPTQQNTAARTAAIPEKAAARFRQKNRRAFEIYDYARNRFERVAT